MNSITKVCIICPEHGEFWQLPYSHLSGRGCNICSKPVYDTNSFIKRAREIHGNKYDYSKVEYVNSITKVCIICPEHGEFWQTPNNHLRNKKCPLCSKINKIKLQSLSTEQFIEKAKKIHGNKYDYSKVEYVNNHTKVCIICPEHGEFWQLPSKHLSKHGCQLCNESHLEKTIRVLLDENNIKYIYQANKKNFTWLNKQSLDFYLPDYNVAIECQGEQHYKPVDFGFNNQNKAEINFLKILENDLKKKKLCYKHNIKLFYFTNESLKNEYEFSSIKKLLNALKSI